MPDRIPLVLDPLTGGPGQLQPPDDLDINLNERVDRLETQLGYLARFLLEQGIEIPPILIERL